MQQFCFLTWQCFAGAKMDKSFAVSAKFLFMPAKLFPQYDNAPKKTVLPPHPMWRDRLCARAGSQAASSRTKADDAMQCWSRPRL